MKKSLSIVSLFLALALIVPCAFGQATATNLLLTTTKLNAAVTSTSQTVLALVSTTGITANNTVIYIDDGFGGNDETVFVNNVLSATQVSVTRGYNGTQANLHLSGSVVLAGPPAAFVYVDPSGSCVAANAFTPTVNILSSRQWICSSITASWVPGYFNAATAAGVTTAVASAAGAVNPSGPLFHVTGALAITAWGSSTSAGLGAGGGSATQPYGAPFCIIPDGAFTTTATNNIALASTAVVNKILCYTFDGTNKKYVPTY